MYKDRKEMKIISDTEIWKSIPILSSLRPDVHVLVTNKILRAIIFMYRGSYTNGSNFKLSRIFCLLNRHDWNKLMFIDALPMSTSDVIVGQVECKRCGYTSQRQVIHPRNYRKEIKKIIDTEIWKSRPVLHKWQPDVYVLVTNRILRAIVFMFSGTYNGVNNFQLSRIFCLLNKHDWSRYIYSNADHYPTPKVILGCVKCKRCNCASLKQEIH